MKVRTRPDIPYTRDEPSAVHDYNPDHCAECDALGDLTSGRLLVQHFPQFSSWTQPKTVSGTWSPWTRRLVR